MNIFDRIPLQEYEKKRLLRDIKRVEDIEDKIELGHVYCSCSFQCGWRKNVGSH
jgi:hypothetical protein